MKKRIKNILANLSEKTELPLSEICREVSIYIQGKNEVIVDGVLSIYSYGSECIILDVCDDSVVVNGSGLYLKNYYHSTLSIGGVIDVVSFGGRICR